MSARIRLILLLIAGGALFAFIYGQLTYEAVYGRYEYSVTDASLPDITARAWGVVALDTGELLVGEHTEAVVPLASVTKLMTALVVLEDMDLTATATVSWPAVITEGRAGKLQAGDTIAVHELLFPLLLESSNDAAEVLAEHHGRDALIAIMNTRAEMLGMTDTHFADPSGLSAENVGTVADMVTLVRTIATQSAHLFDITRLQKYVGANHTWWNSDLISSHPDFRGGKNGYTDEARHTFVGVFEVELGETGSHSLGLIVLGSDDMGGDIATLLEYIRFNVRYQYVI